MIEILVSTLILIINLKILAPQKVKLQVYRFTEGGDLLNSCYCASPFFNETQVRVRDNMQSRLVIPFRPDLTDSSKKFDKGDNSAALEVVEDNIKGIQSSELLCFPIDTDDLGTLFEVGVALAYGHDIISYNDSKDEYVIHCDLECPKVNKTDKKYLFDCNSRKSVISLGYLSRFIDKSQLYYQLNGSNDNLMLSVHYNHVELIDGKFQLIHRDESDRDK